MEGQTNEGIDFADITNAAACLSDRLDGNDARQCDVKDILQRHLGDQPVTTTTAPELYQSLGVFLDNDFAIQLIHYLSRADQDPEVLQQFEEALPPGTASFLRKLLALFGPEATEATDIANENPSGWRTILREVNYDTISESWKVRIGLVTYSGEKTQLEETPNSALILGNGILATVVNAVRSAGLTVLEPERITQFFETIQEFAELAKSEVEATADENESETTADESESETTADE